MVRVLSDMYSTMWVPKCQCGITIQDGRRFTFCEHPFYNEQFKIIMCEKCMGPVFLGLVNPDDIRDSAELRGILQKNAFSLFSDAALSVDLTALKERYEAEESSGETLRDLGLDFTEGADE